MVAEVRHEVDVGGPLPAYPCDACGEPVFRVQRSGELVLIDAFPVPVGMYLIEPGRPIVRQSIVEIYLARREGRELPGYDPHDCPGPPHWTDR